LGTTYFIVFSGVVRRLNPDERVFDIDLFEVSIFCIIASKVANSLLLTGLFLMLCTSFFLILPSGPIAPTPAPTLKPTDPPCFSGSNLVEIQSQGLASMETVKIGDYLKDSETTFSRVYSYGHIDANLEATFLQIHCDDMELPLELSHDHMVYVSGLLNIVRAKDVKIGSKIVGADGMNHVVTGITTVKRRGIYAPLTESGSIIVNGFRVSPYAAPLDYAPFIQHYASHAAWSPLRVVCMMNFGICENETYTNGFSDFIFRAVPFVEHIALHYNKHVQFALTMVAAPFLLLAYAMEQSLKAPMLRLLILVVSCAYLQGKKKKLPGKF